MVSTGRTLKVDLPAAAMLVSRFAPFWNSSLLLAEASGTSGNTEAPQRETARKPSSSPAPLSEDRTPTIKKSDTAGKIVAAGVAALLIGLVLHNNTKRHRNGPVYQAPPPPSAPGGRGRYDRQPLQPMRVPVQGDTRRYQPERRPPRR